GYGTVTNHELTVYVAEGGQSVSQTFISVVGHPALVPEPATMLIFGIGIVTLPCLRRVRKIVRRS
ncbi:MAG: PEP-CTERM sorting domain-containing protein, partial [Planctomycetaceae bacterium]|nr:PEP-CTERM sorting domain-containing protein [Planctomycetaceae bacterium]